MTAAGTPPILGSALDVHAHFLPERYRAAALAAGQDRPDGLPALPEWSAESALRLMDALGIDAAVLSLSTPGTSFVPDGDARAELARQVNDDGAAAVAQHPGRFGFLATLPLPDVGRSLTEVRRAFDDLGADGVCVLTHHDGVYFGDARYEPLLAELNRRRAVVFLHPTSPACWEAVSFGRPRAMIEFLLDTTRTVFDLILSGATVRYPQMKLVIPHAGAALPVLADRVDLLDKVLPRTGPEVDVVAELSRMYFDLAGVPLPRALPALRRLAPDDRILYGSDYPLTGAGLVTELAATLAQALDSGQRDSAWRAAVLRGNAATLFPRLADGQRRAHRAGT